MIVHLQLLSRRIEGETHCLFLALPLPFCRVPVPLPCGSAVTLSVLPLTDIIIRYGYLTWLNQPPRPPATAECCRSRWCAPRFGPDHLTGSILGAGTPPDLAIAFGWLGMYMFASPSSGLVVVTFGRSYGSSSSCSIVPTAAAPAVHIPNYADDYAASMVWNSVADAVLTTGTALPPALPVPGGGGTGTGSSPSSPPSPPPAPPPIPAAGGGSCTCYCPPDEGFGQCFPATSKAECATRVTDPAAGKKTEIFSKTDSIFLADS